MDREKLGNGVDKVLRGLFAGVALTPLAPAVIVALGCTPIYLLGRGALWLTENISEVVFKMNEEWSFAENFRYWIERKSNVWRVQIGRRISPGSFAHLAKDRWGRGILREAGYHIEADIEEEKQKQEAAEQQAKIAELRKTQKTIYESPITVWVDKDGKDINGDQY